MSLFGMESLRSAEPSVSPVRPRGLGLGASDERDAVPFELALLAALLAVPAPAWAAATPGVAGVNTARQTAGSSAPPPERHPGEKTGAGVRHGDALLEAGPGGPRGVERGAGERAGATSTRHESETEPGTSDTSRDARPPRAGEGPAGTAASAAAAPAPTALAKPIVTDATLRAAIVAALRAAAATRSTTPPAKALNPAALADAWAARMQKIEAALVKSGSTFLVPLDTGDGASGQVHLAVRGKSLTATIVTGDADVRRQLESSLGELQKALLGRGFDEAHLRVRTPRGSDRELAERHPEQHPGRQGRQDPGEPHPGPIRPGAAAAPRFSLEKGSNAS